MKKGSPEAKAWGRKMRALRSGRTGRKTVKVIRQASRAGKRIAKFKRKPYHLISDALELAGLGYGAYSAYHGDITGTLVGAGIAVAGAGTKRLAKDHRIGKVHKVTKDVGVKLI